MEEIPVRKLQRRFSGSGSEPRLGFGSPSSSHYLSINESLYVCLVLGKSVQRIGSLPLSEAYSWKRLPFIQTSGKEFVLKNTQPRTENESEKV